MSKFYQKHSETLGKSNVAFCTQQVHTYMFYKISVELFFIPSASSRERERERERERGEERRESCHSWLTMPIFSHEASYTCTYQSSANYCCPRQQPRRVSILLNKVQIVFPLQTPRNQ